MASQPLDGSKCMEVASFIHGYHAYEDIWQPRVGEGHVPRHLSTLFSQFLRRTCNKGVVQVMGEKVNRGGGHGLEVPCVYRLYGPEAYLDRLK